MGGPPRQGHADPLAIVAGNPVAATVPPVPALYRWTLGKSLKDVIDPKGNSKLSTDEVRKVLKRVADGGPLASTASAGP
jgi:hypothetical protein